MNMAILHNSLKLLLIVIVCAVIPTVHGVSDKLWEIINGFPKLEVISQMVDKHLEEIHDRTPLHIIVDFQVDTIVLNTMLEKYMKSRTSYLWNNNELFSNNIKSSTSIRGAVGIYSDISHVRPSDQLEFFGKLWKTRVKYAIWLMGTELRTIIQTLLENYWSLDCLNVAVINTNSECTRARRYTYNPFLMGSYRTGTLVELFIADKFFPNKIKNLHGYKIPISLYDATPHVRLFNHTSLEGAKGSEVEALRYLSSWMNFTIVLKSSPLPLSSYTQYVFNGTDYGDLIGPVGDLIKGRSEILGNAQLFALAGDLKLSFLHPLKSVRIQVVVPLDTESSSIVKIFRYLDPLTESLILVSVALFSLYVFIAHKRDPFITYFRLLFQTNIHEISDRTSERIFMFSWLFFAFIVALAHQTHIMKSLTDLSISQSITSLEDITNSDLKIVLDYTHFKGLKYGEDANVLLHRTEINPNFYDCIERLEKGERVACVGTAPVVISGLHTLNKQLIANKRRIVKHPYIIKTPIFLLSTLIARHGLSYLRQLNKGNIQMYSSGLAHKWQKQDHVREFKETKEFDGPLRLLQFEGIFGLFAICIILANIAFVGEILVSYIQTKMRKKSHKSR